jgi:hypothetical protein
VPLAALSDNFADGASAAYLDELEARFREDPASVDKTWANFFRLLGALLRGALLRAAASAAFGAPNCLLRNKGFCALFGRSRCR